MATFSDLEPVFVVGIGLHRYQRGSDISFVDLGLTAVREALTDADVEWPAVESAHVGTVHLGMAAGRSILRHLGATGLAVAQVENASASGSTAFRLACLDVASGTRDVALALGVDKPDLPRGGFLSPEVRSLPGARVLPVAHFALLADAYQQRHGVSAEQVAMVAVKNHENGALNPYAQRQKVRTLDDVMRDAPLAGSLTRLQCCPIGEGAAAVLVASSRAVNRLGLDRSRAVRVLSSVLRSEEMYPPGQDHDAALTADTAAQALAEAGVSASELDVIEVHDAFTIEELLYLEAMGLCGPGEAAGRLADGEWSIAGRCAVSPSGGLLAMGHPLGPTGVGQVAEICRQLRGEAGDRQQPGAEVGLAHMVGVGAVCAVSVLRHET